MRSSSESGSVRTKIMVSQAIVIVGLIAWFKMYLPRLERQQAASEARERDRKIQTFFRWAVIEDSPRAADMPARSGEQRPQRLRRAPSLQEAEQMLGAPGGRSTDIRGGLHVTWLGTGYKLEGSFDKDRLYCLTLTDRRTGHGANVFESSSSWHPF
jgi:hypothetical protein